MSIRLHCDNSQSVLNAIIEDIDSGELEAWTYDEDGDFTHLAKQWHQKAWLRPIIEDEENIIFSIIAPFGETLSSQMYAAYHGRFLEMLLARHDDIFSLAEVTALADEENDLT